MEVLGHLLRSPMLPKTESLDQPSDSQSGKANEEASLLSSAVWAIEALSVNGKSSIGIFCLGFWRIYFFCFAFRGPCPVPCSVFFCSVFHLSCFGF